MKKRTYNICSAFLNKKNIFTTCFEVELENDEKKMKHLMKITVNFKRRTMKEIFQMKKINIKYLSSHYSRELRISLRWQEK